MEQKNQCLTVVLLLAAVAAMDLRRMLRGPVVPLLPLVIVNCIPVYSEERLRAPSASELDRKRKIDVNPTPPKGKKRLTQSHELCINNIPKLCEYVYVAFPDRN